MAAQELVRPKRCLPKAAVALGLALAAAACTTSAPTAPRGPSAFVIPTVLPNGRVEITIAPSYPLGATLTIPVALVATRGTITGPVTARIMASGINEGGRPAEVLVRELGVTPVTVAAGRRTVTLAWDTKDTKGVVVPADAYSLVLEVRAEDGGTVTVRQAGATLELR